MGMFTEHDDCRWTDARVHRAVLRAIREGFSWGWESIGGEDFDSKAATIADKILREEQP